MSVKQPRTLATFGVEGQPPALFYQCFGAFMSIAIAKRSSDIRFSIYCRSTSLSLVLSRPS